MACPHLEALPCLHPGGEALTRRGLALCQFPVGGVVADIGCGAGYTLRLLHSMGLQAVGVDAHAFATQPSQNTFPVVQACATALPFAPASLHGVVCECVLSLLEQPEMALRQYYAACKAGAMLLVTDMYAKQGQRAEAPGAWPSQTKERMEKTLETCGWECVLFEDHSAALPAFVAQLVWHGSRLPFCVPPSLNVQALCGKTLGYGLWVARKKEKEVL